ncbi:probable E3 ubiquitin-protein ligase makorin-1 [Calliphora vicina]|uniref:probable E3 ubiquitin-protein ligase makorin-1 n=1 Tax=Calliphora vicina TaxID=7373 RepID=UPI00325AD590
MSTAALTTATAALSLEPSSSSDAAAAYPVTTTTSTAFSTNPMAGETAELHVNASTSSSTSHLPLNPAICRYFQRGICRFGSMCRFSHDLTGGEIISNSTTTTTGSAMPHERPSTSRHNWANAPVFIPKADHTGGEVLQTEMERSWADVVGATASRALAGTILNVNESSSINEICPFEGTCPYGMYCAYAIHLELCEMCDQFCLHPTDETQRKKHKKECLQQHEQAMELSFAIARSKDKTCGICFDTIMEKAGREKRFGILPNCNHIFCLECIRKWRQAKQFEHKITRSCPECRVASDFVCPSAFWVETKEEKDKLLGDYRKALGIKDCKYFKKGDGKCPFGNKCFYKHALPNGDLVDVGCPKKARKLHRSNNEIMNLLDIYLYEFLDQRELNFYDYITSTSDESDDDDEDDDE